MNLKKGNLGKLVYSLFLILMVLLMPIMSAYSLEDHTAKPLTSLPKELHEKPSIAVYNKSIHVVWNKWPDEYNSEIYYVRSLDNGETWNNVTKVSSNTTKAVYPDIAIFEKTIHVVWKDYRDGSPEIYYLRSMTYGETWESQKRLTYNNTIKNNIYDLHIIANGINLYLTWKDYRSGSSEIFFKKSNDNGDTWTPDQRLTSDYTPSYSPALCVEGDNLYIAYDDWGKRANICFLKSTDNGTTWTDKTYITDTEQSGTSEQPDISVNKNNICLVWQDDRTTTTQILFKKSNDYGETWGEVQQLSFTSNASTNPRIYQDLEKIIVIWKSRDDKFLSIFYKVSLDRGETWSNTQKIPIEANCYEFDISGIGGNIHLALQIFHETGWADIWHVGDSNYTIPIVDPVEHQDNNTSGLEVVNLIITILILIIISKVYYNKKKGDER